MGTIHWWRQWSETIWRAKAKNKYSSNISKEPRPNDFR